jgi:hypothetical protein
MRWISINRAAEIHTAFSLKIALNREWSDASWFDAGDVMRRGTRSAAGARRRAAWPGFLMLLRRISTPNSLEQSLRRCVIYMNYGEKNRRESDCPSQDAVRHHSVPSYFLKLQDRGDGLLSNDVRAKNCNVGVTDD